MTPDLLTLMRHKYAKRHPGRDARMMPMSDSELALATALDHVLGQFEKRLDRLEAKAATGDPE